MNPVMGPNGAGKSTLIQTILGLDCHKQPREARIGHMPENSPVLDALMAAGPDNKRDNK